MNPLPEQIEVRRSRRRTRTVSAFREGELIVVAIPARFTAAEEHEWVQKMAQRIAKQEQRLRPSDAQLLIRANELSAKYLESKAIPHSVAWVSNQERRWGSCTPADRTIRLSSRLKGMPSWVVDYVLIHELAHLLQMGHNAQFWKLVEAYPRTERARGFLEGIDHLEGISRADDAPS